MQSMMTGVIKVIIDETNNLVTLTYIDENQETAKLTKEEIESGHENVFSFVSAVQSKR